ncbi:uncharacterized protein K02A2.6-like [Cydia splendana]|uniref:uncharacterized protein K02A2.6-like n=1 Tax=Cydia splendana TaxID=1100963 RepID=UPI00300D30F7
MSKTLPFNIKEFNLRSGKWNTYISQLTAWFDITNVKPDTRVQYLIAVVGTETLDLIIDLCYPAEPDTVSFDDIVSKVREHLSPKRSELAERMTFRACKQTADQSINEYLAQLKQLAKKCNFTGSTCLEDNLRDQLAYGLRSDAIRFKLLTEDELTYSRAVEIATSLEAADRDSKASGPSSGAGSGTSAPMSTREEDVHAVRVGGGGARAPPRRRQPAAAPRARCPRCLGTHHPRSCSFMNTECYVCGKKGHIAKACKNRKHNRVNVCTESTDTSDDVGSEDGDDEYDVPLYSIDDDTGGDEPWWRTVTVNGVKVRMQLDCGAAISAVSSNLFNQLFKNVNLLPPKTNLKMYAGQKVTPKGIMLCEVMYGDKKKSDLKLVIVDSDDSPPIIGRRWMTALGIKCSPETPESIYSMNNGREGVGTQLAREFPQVFAQGTGKFTGKPIQLRVASDARPVFCKPRPVPHALRAAVEAELERLQADGVISPVETSEWGTPVVPVIKKSGEVRLCGDFKITLNPVLEDDKYPIPRIDEIFSNLQGGQLFSKIDLSHAYQQLPLTEESKQLCVIVTHKGSFCYNRLPFGIKCAMSKFQRVLDSLFKNMNLIAVYCDDILVTGVNDDDHYKRLISVFKILSEAGLRIAQNKCIFFQKSHTDEQNRCRSGSPSTGHRIAFKGILRFGQLLC